MKKYADEKNLKTMISRQQKMIKKLGKMQDEIIGKDLNLDPARLKELKKKRKKKSHISSKCSQTSMLSICKWKKNKN